MRSCKALSTAIGVWLGKKGLQWTQDTMTDAFVSAGIDAVCTGGVATIVTALYELGNQLKQGYDVVSFLALPRSKQSQAILAILDGDDVDIALRHVMG